MKKLLTLFFFLSTAFLLFGQQFSVQKPEITNEEVLQRWGNDVAILRSEPIGNLTGIQKSTGKIFVAVNDTASTANLGLLVFTSTDLGQSWQPHNIGITLREPVENLKLVRTGLDSIYLFFQYSTNIYCWNVETTRINYVHAGNYRSYDAAGSSTGSLYVFTDSLTTNSIVRYSSLDGGFNWVNRGVVTSGGAMPKISMSATGDTVILLYYGPVLADTASSIIRAARYRQTSNGVLASAGFQDVATEYVPKIEYLAAARNGEVFFAYTTGLTGDIDINFRKSVDGGTTYLPAVTLVNPPGRDEYWFDVKPFSFGSGGFDIIYYSDSITAVPTTTTDRIYYTVNLYGMQSVPVPGEIVNQYPLVWSPNNYAPQLVELYFSNDDAGVIYVADSSGSKMVVWDYLSNYIPVELSSFTALVIEEYVQLDWITSTEKNNAGFEVQKFSGSTWEKIGFIAGKGTTTERNIYSFTEKYQKSGSFSYRLKQIDFDGTFAYSEEVQVDLKVPGEFILLQNYPNPFNPVSKIKYNIAETELVSLKVTDVLGRETAMLVNEQQEPGFYEVEFNAASYSSGVYFYTLKAGKFSETKKMILMK
jgi:hypothetical protein